MRWFGKSTKPPVAPLLVMVLAFIGALNVLKWIWNAAPQSIHAAIVGFNQWATTPTIAPADVLNLLPILFILFLAWLLMGVSMSFGGSGT